MKLLLSILVILVSAKSLACETIFQATSEIISRADGAYLGYVTSLRVRDFEKVYEGKFPPFNENGMNDREIKVSVTETIFGERLNLNLIDIKQSWCGDAFVRVGEKVVIIKTKSGSWNVRKIGLNPSDIMPSKP